jgi:hypothetical protein
VAGFGRSVEFTRVPPPLRRAALRCRRLSRAGALRTRAGRRRDAGRRLEFAGDYLVHPSLEGALRSGERAAAALLGAA